MAEPIGLRVNGVDGVVEADPATPLLAVLRDHARADGHALRLRREPVRRLQRARRRPRGRRPATRRSGPSPARRSRRSKGSARRSSRTRCRRAFIAEQAMQCGYCVSGVLISAAALLRRNPDPSEAEVRAALDRNLCRCGAHNRMVRAVLRAAGRGSPHEHAPNAPARLRPGALPGNLRANPRLSQWLAVLADGIVEVSPGKVEIGQGILTALAQIVADELDVEPAARAPRAGDARRAARTKASPRAASRCRIAALALRHVCAEARAHLPRRRRRAARRAPKARSRVEDGAIAGPGNARTSYWELADDGRRSTATPPPVPRRSRRPRAARRRVPRPRSTSPTRCSARPRFIHDLSLPGMLHGRVLRPRAPARAARRASTTRPRARAGRRRRRARRQLRSASSPRPRTAPKRRSRGCRAGATWTGGDDAAGRGALDGLARRRQPVETEVVACARRRRRRAPARTLRRAYTRPYLAHASIAPSCAVAQWSGGERARLDAQPGHLQSARRPRARAARCRRSAIVVEHVEGAGCYGHNGADDVALDAALLARAAPRPAGARAVVARRRAGLGAVRRRDGGRASRPTSTPRGAVVALAARDLEQRPRRAARAAPRTPALLAA